MGNPKTPKPVKLVMSLIMGAEGLFEGALADLRNDYGVVDFVSSWSDFDFTDYYAREMGRHLKRRFAAFQNLIPPDALPAVKHRTNAIEHEYARGGKRQVNIDPGYVTSGHMVLATTKAYAHRPYLRDGIYVDLTLIYEKGSYQPLKWTYPDYRQFEIIQMFNTLRGTYLREVRTRGRDDG